METEVQPAPATGAGNDDVRADVVAAIEQLRGPSDTAPEPEQEIAAATSEDAAPFERPRNERGQFIRADGTVDTEAEAQRVPDADPSADKPEVPSTAPEPPTSWSADAKAEWLKLSPALQQAVIKRETEINEGGRRWSEEKRAVETMLDPIRQQAQRTGLSFDEGFKRLVSMSEWMERDPSAAIRALAQSYGVNLAQPQTGMQPPPVVPQPPQQQPVAQPSLRDDPVVQQLTAQLSSLKEMVAQQHRSEAESSIQSFATAQGHEHFEAVKASMGQLIGTGQATDLQDAYDKAIWLDPTIRSSLIAAQTAKAAEEKRAAEQAAVKKARAGSLSLNGSPVGAPAASAKPEYETVREAAQAAYAQHMGG